VIHSILELPVSPGHKYPQGLSGVSKMVIDRNELDRNSIFDALHFFAVIGLWMVACSVDKIPGYRNSMDFIV
jgi:hypothetical protein